MASLLVSFSVVATHFIMYTHNFKDLLGITRSKGNQFQIDRLAAIRAKSSASTGPSGTLDMKGK